MSGARRVESARDHDGLVLFDPTEGAELLRGWQLHAVRRRTIHELAARRSQLAAYWLSAVVALFAAIAGSSAFVAVEVDGSSTGLGAVALSVGMIAAVAAPLQSTLDLGGRAERHRQAAVEYKRLVRTFERISPDRRDIPRAGQTGEFAALLETLATRIGDADAAAPILPTRLARHVESLPITVTGDSGRVGAVSDLAVGTHDAAASHHT